ncbi:hypothetical protein IWZ01DRAFT_51393 [Phyllosticta capitalensis]
MDLPPVASKLTGLMMGLSDKVGSTKVAGLEFKSGLGLSKLIQAVSSKEVFCLSRFVGRLENHFFPQQRRRAASDKRVLGLDRHDYGPIVALFILVLSGLQINEVRDGVSVFLPPFHDKRAAVAHIIHPAYNALHRLLRDEEKLGQDAGALIRSLSLKAMIDLQDAGRGARQVVEPVVGLAHPFELCLQVADLRLQRLRLGTHAAALRGDAVPQPGYLEEEPVEDAV